MEHELVASIPLFEIYKSLNTQTFLLAYTSVVSTLNMINIRRWAKTYSDKKYITLKDLLTGDIDVIQHE
jgi:hypothetical protein